MKKNQHMGTEYRMEYTINAPKISGDRDVLKQMGKLSYSNRKGNEVSQVTTNGTGGMTGKHAAKQMGKNDMKCCAGNEYRTEWKFG